MAEDIEARFEHYCAAMVSTLGHVDRHQPARWYLKGLVLPGGRKSVEPMAARVRAQDVRSAHQSCITWWPIPTGAMRGCLGR